MALWLETISAAGMFVPMTLVVAVHVSMGEWHVSVQTVNGPDRHWQLPDFLYYFCTRRFFQARANGESHG
jgi:hypothetical protein